MRGTWLTRVVLLALLSSMVVGVGGAAPASADPGSCPTHPFAMFEYVRVAPQSEGACVAVQFSPLNPHMVGVWVTPSDNVTTVGGITYLQAGVSFCLYMKWSYDWDRSCLSNPSMEVSQGTGIWPSTTTPSASGGGNVGPCVDSEFADTWEFNTVGLKSIERLCVYTGGNVGVSSNVSGKSVNAYAQPALCVNRYPAYSCYVLESLAYVNGGGPRPVVRETVAVCERTWPYPPCVVREDRWITP